MTGSVVIPSPRSLYFASDLVDSVRSIGLRPQQRLYVAETEHSDQAIVDAVDVFR